MRLEIFKIEMILILGLRTFGFMIRDFNLGSEISEVQNRIFSILTRNFNLGLGTSGIGNVLI